VGTINECLVHPREVFKAAVMTSAAVVVVGHNHPSGDTTPSQQDLDLTKKLIEAGKILSIGVLDHVIVGDPGRYTSIREQTTLWV
jgi:DNA repair protein RadC